VLRAITQQIVCFVLQDTGVVESRPLPFSVAADFMLPLVRLFALHALLEATVLQGALPRLNAKREHLLLARRRRVRRATQDIFALRVELLLRTVLLDFLAMIRLQLFNAGLVSTVSVEELPLAPHALLELFLLQILRAAPHAQWAINVPIPSLGPRLVLRVRTTTVLHQLSAQLAQPAVIALPHTLERCPAHKGHILQVVLSSVLPALRTILAHLHRLHQLRAPVRKLVESGSVCASSARLDLVA